MLWKHHHSQDGDKIKQLLAGELCGCAWRGSPAHQADAVLCRSGARPGKKAARTRPGETREKNKVGKGYIKNQVSYGMKRASLSGRRDTGRGPAGAAGGS